VCSSDLAKDVSEVLDELDFAPEEGVERPVIAYHSACSLQHGQKLHDLPMRVLAKAGYEVRDVADGHLCCGSAGVYNLLQPDLAERLLARKIETLERTGADVVAAGNIGCINQLERATSMPVIHPVELIDWATGGPRPAALTD
jgi:glycolate oxidase iron-sulfur subunit